MNEAHAFFRTKAKEAIALTGMKPGEFVHDKDVTFSFQGTSCCTHQPNFVFQAPRHMVVVEIDEHEHKHGLNSRPDKESSRMVAIACGLMTTVEGCRGVIFVRVNPDSYTVDDVLEQGPSLPARLAVAWATIEALCKDAIADKMGFTAGKHYMAVKYMFYSIKTAPDGSRVTPRANAMLDGHAAMRMGLVKAPTHPPGG